MASTAGAFHCPWALITSNPGTTTANHNLMKHVKLDILCSRPFGKQLVKETQKREKRKWKWRCSRGPRFLPEVSSAPSWFEFCSFLLTLAAGADMFSPLNQKMLTRNITDYFSKLRNVQSSYTETYRAPQLTARKRKYTRTRAPSCTSSTSTARTRFSFGESAPSRTHSRWKKEKHAPLRSQRSHFFSRRFHWLRR